MPLSARDLRQRILLGLEMVSDELPRSRIPAGRRVLLAGLIGSFKIFILQAIDDESLLQFVETVRRIAYDDDYAHSLRTKLRGYIEQYAAAPPADSSRVQ